MKKVKVGNRFGVTTSIIPHRNGKYPVWFEDSKVVEFIDSNDVIFNYSNYALPKVPKPGIGQAKK